MSKKFFPFLFAIVFLAPVQPGESQSSRKVVQIGYLGNYQSSSGLSVGEKDFVEELRKRGWIENQNLVIEWRYWENRVDRLRAQAAEMVRRKVDIIVTSTGTAAHAAQKATATIPIVMVSSADAVSQGLIISLARPGGNVTGLTVISPAIDARRIELLKETFPRVSRVAYLRCKGTSRTLGGKLRSEAPGEAQAQKIHLVPVEVQGPGEVEEALTLAMRDRADALFVSDCTRIPVAEIIEVAAKSRLPAMYPLRHFVTAGGLMSYGADQNKSHSRAAHFVDKILKGARPADLPVEQPTKFEFVINLKTARQIGVTIPPQVLMWADQVIK